MLKLGGAMHADRPTSHVGHRPPPGTAPLSTPAALLSWYRSGGDAAAGLRVAQQLLIASPQFHVLGDDAAPRNTPRAPPEAVSGRGRGYKALVVLYLNGGADSFNMLVPREGCSNASGAHDLYAEYAATRTAAGVTL